MAGTRENHQFKPINTNRLCISKISNDITSFLANVLDSDPKQVPTFHAFSFQPGQYFACMYDNSWWIGHVCAISSWDATSLPAETYFGSLNILLQPLRHLQPLHQTGSILINSLFWQTLTRLSKPCAQKNIELNETESWIYLISWSLCMCILAKYLPIVFAFFLSRIKLR